MGKSYSLLQRESSTADSWLTRESTAVLKCLGIIMMVYYHFFSSTAWVLELWVPYTLYISGYNVQSFLAVFGKICVAIFSFITGYFMYFNRSKFKSIRYRAEKLWNILLPYWIIGGGVLLFGLVVGEPLPDVSTFILNMFGAKTSMSDYVNLCFSWYVLFYIELILITPLIIRLLQKGNLIIDLLGIVVFFAVGSFLPDIELFGTVNFFTYASVVMTGYVASRFCLLEAASNWLNKKVEKTELRLFVDFILILVVFVLRRKLSAFNGLLIDFIYAPIFIFAVADLVKNKKNKNNQIKEIVSVIATNSMYIWFLHGMFFTPNRTVQWLAYWPRFSILITAWVFILLIPISQCINLLVVKINRSLLRRR